MGKMSKAVRIRRMLSRGASVEQIAKATGSSKPYIYTVNMKMKKEIQEKEWATIETLAKTGITPPPPENLLPAHEQPPQKTWSMWQRFKAIVGF
jgi:hypothetical protein